jgi:hypothetical protein
MIEIDADKFKVIKDFIFKEGRLLERKLFQYFFEDGSKNDVLKVLEAYQNQDGGFGNGIEPDLLCPDSTAIGAETGLYILDLLDSQDNLIAKTSIDWIFKNTNDEGFIEHPPKNLFKFPHQPWWENQDGIRILVIAGILKRWRIDNTYFFDKVKRYYSTLSHPEKYKIYDYPYFIYLMYCGESREEEKVYFDLVDKLPEIIEENKSHYPIFSRYWFYFSDLVELKLLQSEAQFFINNIKDDGGIINPFEELPWWRSIFTLDGLIIMKKLGLLEII